MQHDMLDGRETYRESNLNNLGHQIVECASQIAMGAHVSLKFCLLIEMGHQISSFDFCPQN